MSRKSGFPPIGKYNGSAEYELREPEYENPFKLPSDDKIFRIREEEKKKRQEDRENNTRMKVWEKTKTDVTSRTLRLKELMGDTRGDGATETKTETEANKPVAVLHRQEKENMTEFTAKKREMFLVQMSLDTKREEIRKLEEKAQMKEQAVQRSEQMLEEDSMRFEAFLKENDKKAHDAIKFAEEETKRKQEMTSKIKGLTQQIQALNSEMSKHREALEDCMRYKSFLDMLTPPEWFEQHKRAHEDKKNAIRKERFDKRYKEWEVGKRRILDQYRRDMEARRDNKRDRRRGVNTPEEEDEEEFDIRTTIPPPPRIEEEIVDLPEEEPPMYFTDPQQLMDIFAQLEEQNLFLIQNSQETEHTLEELQHSFKHTKVSMESQSGQLQEQINELQVQIIAEKQRAKVLQQKRLMAAEASSSTDQNGPQSHQEKEKLLAELNAKVRQVYDQCGYESSSRPQTIQMLSTLESKLESLLTEIERMPEDYVIKAEKEKEKRRRERKREEQQALQIRLQEERNKRATERSLQAPKKRSGRQVMFRSKPVRKETKNQGDDQNDKDNNDELKYLS